MADVDDRWFKTDRETGERVRTARYGTSLRYAARWRDDQRKQRSKCFRTKKEADDHLAKVTVDLARGQYVDPKAGRITLRDWVTIWEAQQTSNVSSQYQVSLRLRTHVLPQLGGRALVAITPSVVQSWLRGRRGEVADNYARLLLGNLSAVLQAAVDDGRIARNPCRAPSVKAPPRQTKKVVPWSHEWVDAMRDQLDGRYREFVTVGAGVGLRQGEIFGLAVEDIDFLRKVIHVRRQVKILGGKLFFDLPKRGKTRDVPLADSVGLRLAAHIKAFPPTLVSLPWGAPDGKPREARLMFTTPNGNAIHRQTFTDYTWRPALKSCGIPQVRENGSHALRHRFASVVLDGGASIRDLADWLGHEDPGFTLRVYSHLMPGSEARMRQAVDAGFASASARGPERQSAPDVR
jgi:integrase